MANSVDPDPTASSGAVWTVSTQWQTVQTLVKLLLNGKQCRSWSDCTFRSYLNWVYTMANSVDPDQTVPSGAIWTGSTLLTQTWPSQYLNHYAKHLSRLMTKPTKWSVCPEKNQISLGICPVWSVFAMGAEDPMFLHADSEDSDQTGWMPRLIWVFAGCNGYFVGFVMRQLIFFW